MSETPFDAHMEFQRLKARARKAACLKGHQLLDAYEGLGFDEVEDKAAIQRQGLGRALLMHFGYILKLEPEGSGMEHGAPREIDEAGLAALLAEARRREVDTGEAGEGGADDAPA